MQMRTSWAVAVTMALAATPAWAQGHQHGQPTPAGQGAAQAHAMFCTMGVLPHPGMGAGMMGGQGMGGTQHGAMMGGMQHGAEGAGATQRDSARAGGMQHGAAAQGGGMQHGAAPAGGAAMAHGGMGGMPHPVTPTMLLHHAQELGLTGEQQAQVRQLAEASQATCQQHLELARTSHEAAAGLLQDVASPDVNGYEAKLREAGGHLLDAHVAVVKAGAQAAALLTPAQREKLAATSKQEQR
jgi:hypothetical protein